MVSAFVAPSRGQLAIDNYVSRHHFKKLISAAEDKFRTDLFNVQVLLQMKIAGKLEDKLVKVPRREYIFPALDIVPRLFACDCHSITKYEISIFKIKFMK